MEGEIGEAHETFVVKSFVYDNYLMDCRVFDDAISTAQKYARE